MTGITVLVTGNGGGKSTTSLGVGLRALGHNQKVFLVRLAKYSESGETLFKHPNWRIASMCPASWKSKDELLSLIGREVGDFWLSVIKAEVRTNPVDILILDELALLAGWNLVSQAYVTKFLTCLKHQCPNTSIYITGRYAPKWLEDLADFVIEINEKKSPKKMVCIKGVNF